MISKGAVRVQKKNLWQDALYWVLLLALLTAGGFLLFTNLGETGISDCDEARHGINAYEMMQSGDYVVTTYRGEPDYWNLKPPLTDYCIMLGYRLFGYNALGLRFYSALSMMPDHDRAGPVDPAALRTDCQPVYAADAAGVRLHLRTAFFTLR